MSNFDNKFIIITHSKSVGEYRSDRTSPILKNIKSIRNTCCPAVCFNSSIDIPGNEFKIICGQGGTFGGYGETQPTSSVSALVGNSFNLDGSGSVPYPSEHIIIPHVPEQLLTTAFTLTIWRYVNSLIDDDYMMEKGQSNNYGFKFKHSPLNGLHFRCYTATTPNDNSTYGGWNNIATASIWQHFAVVYDGTQDSNTTRLKLYRNGSFYNAAGFFGTIPASIHPSSASIYIGSGWPGVSPFAGKIHNTAIFNIALTPEQVTELYDCRSNDLRTLSFANAIVAYPGLLEPETAFPTITDYSGYSSGSAVNMEEEDIVMDRPPPL